MTERNKKILLLKSKTNENEHKNEKQNKTKILQINKPDPGVYWSCGKRTWARTGKRNSAAAAEVSVWLRLADDSFSSNKRFCISELAFCGWRVSEGLYF